MKQCAACVISGVEALLPAVLESKQEELRLSLASRKYAGSRPASAQSHDVFQIVLHLMTSSVFRRRIVHGGSGLLRVIAGFLEQVASNEQFAKFQQDLFVVIEALSQDEGVLLAQHDAVLKELCPTLASLLSTRDGDTRFHALKLISDILLVLLRDSGVYTHEAAAPVESTRLIDELLESKFLAKCSSILADENPIPLFGLKLLSAVVERNPRMTQRLADMGLVPVFVAFLDLDHPNNNVNNLRLLESVAGLYVHGSGPVTAQSFGPRRCAMIPSIPIMISAR